MNSGLFIKIISAIAVALLSVWTALAGVLGISPHRMWQDSEKVDANVNTNRTVLDEEVHYQTMRGFGASACWWGQEVGQWENAREVLSYLYDRENGIGLNIYRYNLGAGSAGDESLYIANRRTECFLQADGTLDFTVDAGAQAALATARELAGDDLRVSLFCNSPPVSLTKNGKGYGAPPQTADEPQATNLDAAQYQAFADYCYAAAAYFLQEGYRVTDIAPMNEPQYAWRAWYNADGSYSCNQEGCSYAPEEALALFQVMVKRFDRSCVDRMGCKLSLFESGEMQGADSPAAVYLDLLVGVHKDDYFYNRRLRQYFDSLSTHSYWSSAETKQAAADYLAEKYPAYDIACTEYCQMLNDWNTGVHHLLEAGAVNGLGIEYGIAMANIIMDDLTILNAVEWDWWTGCSYGVYPDGLVYINADDHSDIQTSKRLWCLGNFSKFIAEGAVRLACSAGADGVRSVAFRNPDGSTAIVYLNTADAAAITALPDSMSGEWRIFVTDETHDLAQTAAPTDAALTLPARSVVTAVLATEIEK